MKILGWKTPANITGSGAVAEGGNGPLEAWARGTRSPERERGAVVAASAGVHKPIIVPGETGLLVDNDQGWADAIAQLAEDAALRQRMQARSARPAVAA